MGPGLSRLALVLETRMSQHAKNPVIVELGTIQSDMGLKCDHFNVTIPKGSYEVCRSLTLPDPMTTTSDGSNVTRPTQFAPLKSDDRVLVVWLNEGTVPVIIDVVVST